MLCYNFHGNASAQSMINNSEPSQDILVEKSDNGSCIVTLNRPGKRNCVSLAMWTALENIFHELDTDPLIRTIVLVGAGGHFSSGADINEFESLRNTPSVAERYESVAESALLAINGCTKPTIAAISGACVGGGCSLALACDLRIADHTTRIGITASRIGIVYGQLELDLLLSAVGITNAKFIMFTGELFSAERAFEMQLVNRLADNAKAYANVIADEIAKNAPMSVSGAKFILSALQSGAAVNKSAEIAHRIQEAVRSADYIEGRRAFSEKRRPRFTGR